MAENLTPRLGLHLSPEDERRPYRTLRLEQSGPGEESNLSILDREFGALKDRQGNQAVYSPETPQGQMPGDIWNETL